MKDQMPSAPPVNHTGPEPDVQVPGNVGLAQADGFHDPMHRTLRSQERGKNAQTRRFRQQSEVTRPCRNASSLTVFLI